MSNLAGGTQPNTERPDSASRRQPREIQLEVAGLGEDGMGTARFEDRNVRVKNGLPGESVVAKVLRKRRGVLYTEAFQVFSPSSDRVASACNNFPRCGGCVLHHLDYEAQLKLKEQTLLRALQANNVEPSRVAVPVHGPRLHYRSRRRLLLSSRDVCSWVTPAVAKSVDEPDFE